MMKTLLALRASCKQDVPASMKPINSFSYIDDFPAVTKELNVQN